MRRISKDGMIYSRTVIDNRSFLRSREYVSLFLQTPQTTLFCINKSDSMLRMIIGHHCARTVTTKISKMSNHSLLVSYKKPPLHHNTPSPTPPSTARINYRTSHPQPHNPPPHPQNPQSAKQRPPKRNANPPQPSSPRPKRLRPPPQLQLHPAPRFLRPDPRMHPLPSMVLPRAHLRHHRHPHHHVLFRESVEAETVEARVLCRAGEN